MLVHDQTNMLFLKSFNRLEQVIFWNKQNNVQSLLSYSTTYDEDVQLNQDIICKHKPGRTQKTHILTVEATTLF